MIDVLKDKYTKPLGSWEAAKWRGRVDRRLFHNRGSSAGGGGGERGGAIVGKLEGAARLCLRVNHTL